MMSMLGRLTACLFVFMTLLSATDVQAEYRLYKPDNRSRLALRIDDATDFLREMLNAGDESVPSSILSKAHGVIIMRTFKAGFIVGGRGGEGIAMRRDHMTGEWSPPVFVRTAQLSIGWQAGAQTVESIIVIMNPKGLRMLEQSKVKLGVGGGLALGPYGRDAHAKIGPNVVAVSYSRAMGLFGGVDIEGGALMRDDKANHKFYRNRSLTVNDILWEGAVEMPPEAKELHRMLKDASN